MTTTLLTIVEASRAYHVDRSAIYRAIKAGRMTVDSGRVNPIEIEQLIGLGHLRVDIGT